MNSKSRFILKAAALSAGTVALAFGVAYFAGSAPQGAAPSGPPEARVNFKATLPVYEPGSRMLIARSGQQESSIEVFKRANIPPQPPAKAGAQAEAVPGKTEELATSKNAGGGFQLPAQDLTMSPAEIQKIMSAVAERQTAALAEAKARGYGGVSRSQSLALSGRPHGADQARSQANQGLKSKNRVSFGGAGANSGRMPASKIQSDMATINRAVAMADKASADSVTGVQLSGGGLSPMSPSGSDGRNGSSGDQSAGQAAPATPAQDQSGSANMSPPPVTAVWPYSINFDRVYKFETAKRLVVVMNTGESPLKISDIREVASSPFSKQDDTCTGKSLAPGKSCTFKVKFAPGSAKVYDAAFEISTDGGRYSAAYKAQVVVKGNAKKLSGLWYWRADPPKGDGYINRVEFGQVPENFSLEQSVRIHNDTGENWYGISFDISKLPSVFKLGSDGCGGKSLPSGRDCFITLVYTPTTKSNQKNCKHYGMYQALSMNNGRKSWHPRPTYPDYMFEAPAESALAGTLVVKARPAVNFHYTSHIVLEIPVKGNSSAPFPVPGVESSQKYFYFK